MNIRRHKIGEKRCSYIGNKIIGLLLAVIVLLTSLSYPEKIGQVEAATEGTYASWSAAANGAVLGVDYVSDSSGNVTEIYTALGLAYFASEVNKVYNFYTGVTVTLKNDINLEDAGVIDYNATDVTSENSWTSIGTSASDNIIFKGTFDGNGKTISGIYANVSTSYIGGLFGHLSSSAVVQDLTVADVCITNATSHVGAIAAYNNGKISNCTVNSGTISGTQYVGGIAGYNYRGSIENCNNYATVSGTEYYTYIGGIIGYSNGGTVTECSNLGDATGIQYVGGIVGYTDNGLKITTCYNNATITGSSYVGGISGRAYKASIATSYNTGNLCGNDSVGGIAGNVQGSGGSEGIAASIMDCYSITTITSNSNYTSNSNRVGGVVGLVSSDSSVSNCYSVSSSAGAYGGTGSGYTITNCYYDSIFYTGTAKTYETGLTTAEMSVSSFVTTLGNSFAYKSVEDTTFYYPYLVAFGSDTASASGTGLASETWTDYGETATEGTDYSYETTDDILYIYTVKGLAYFSKEVSEGTYLTSTVELEADLDLSVAPVISYSATTVDATSSWLAIGTSSNSFSGTFNGNDHTISGIYIKATATNQGLFGYISGATINDLTIDETVITGGAYMGNLVGDSSNSTISNCYNLADITGTNEEGSVGGLIGKSNKTTIEDCYNIGNVTGNMAGGLVGAANASTVKTSYNIGAISGTYAGGLIGQSTSTLTIENCYNVGVIKASFFGSGIATIPNGKGDTTISNSYNNATISIVGDEEYSYIYAIGLADEVTNCYYNSDKLTSTGDSAISLTSYEMSGDDALTNMNLSDNNAWAVTDTVYSGFTSKAYYPHLIDNKQTTSLETVAEAYFSGSGTSTSPYEISSLEDLKTLSSLVESGVSTTGIYFVQTSDIELVDYTPIGTFDTNFNGKYDGDGYTISGSEINALGDTDSHKAVFGYTGSSAYISNLVVNTTITYTSSTLTSGYYIAGVVAINTGTIENCYFTGSVRGEKNVGAIAGTNSGTVKNCYSIGAVSGNISVGGLVGLNTGTITSCYVAGTFLGGSYASSGAVVGANNGTTSNCYYLLSVYNQSTGSNSSSTGITVLKESEMSGIGEGCSSETMSGFDTSVWTFVSDGYPILTNNPEYLVVIFEAPDAEFTIFTERLSVDATVSEPSTDKLDEYPTVGYIVRWYEEDSITAFDFDTEITAITTLTAGLEEVLATGITLNETAVEELVVDDTATLQATVLPTTALNQSVTWSTSDSGIATVVDGVVTGVTSGEVTITATNDQGHTDTCTVTVVGKTPTTSVEVENWTYGDTANDPTTTTDSNGSISYKYSRDGETFTSTIPSDMGTYYIKAYTSETSTYQSSESISYRFTIEKKEVAVIWIDQETSYVYTGNTLTVPTASYTDVKGTSVSLMVEEQDDKTFCMVGAYVFEVSVIDPNYVLKSGTDTKALSIAQATNTITSFSISDYEYGSTATTPEVEATFGASTVSYAYYEDAACEKEISKPSDAGIYYVKATIAGTTNYTEATATTAYEIKKKALTSGMLNITGTYTYTGSEIKPIITMSDGTLLTSDDYEVTYSHNIKASEDTATVTVTATLDGNYDGIISTTFDIEKANQVITVNAIEGKQYGDDEFTLSIAGQKDTSGTVTYSMETNDVITLDGDRVTNIGVGTVKIKAEVAGDNNYNSATTTYDLTISKADAPIIIYPDATDLVYGQTLSESDLSDSSEYGIFAWADGTIIPTVINEGYEVIFTPYEDTEKYYETITDTAMDINIIVEKQEVSVVIEDAEIVRGMGVPIFSGVVTGDYEYDLVTPNYVVVADNMVAGTYEITMSNMEEFINYDIQVVTGTLTIIDGYTVTINDTTYTDVAYGSLLEEPDLGKIDGYYVVGWETADGTSWDFDADVVTQDIELQPVWEEEIVDAENTAGTDTGDHTNPFYYIILMGISFAVIIYYSKKKFI